MFGDPKHSSEQSQSDCLGRKIIKEIKERIEKRGLLRELLLAAAKDTVRNERKNHAFWNQLVFFLQL